MTDTTVTKPEKQAALSRELSEFLVEMSIGVHRYAMYPPGHPSLDPVVENIVGRLAELFVDRDALSIGVAERQLVIEGVATDQKHPVLSDLASRLHGHQLAAFSFELGVTATEVSRLLEVLAQESEREGTPIGLLPPEQFPKWPHARLFRVGYENLELTGDGSDVVGMDRASSLWLALAQAAMATDDPEAHGIQDAGAVARSISERPQEAAYDQVIVGYLRQLAEELKGGETRETEKIRQKVSTLLGGLDDSTLDRLVSLGGSPGQRKQFLLDANQSLAVDSVMKVLDSAARSEEQSISNSMTRLLTKLATHASTGSGPQRSQADTALRDNVESLIEGWALKDPNPEAYTNVLDSMARAAPVFSTPDHEEEALTGAERLVQMALEVDAYGPLVDKALQDLMADTGTGRILELLDKVPETNQVVQRVRDDLTSPEKFRELLTGGRLDDASLKTLVEQMGVRAIEPLLDVLADSDDRSVRRRVFDSLAGLGPEVAQRAIERLSDTRWFVLRNMLALLQRLADVPDTFDLRPYLEHDDHRVRREAFPLAMNRHQLRDRMLVAALSDEDERMVRMGLLELQEAIPRAVIPSLVNRVVLDESRSSEIRAFALKVLRHTTAPLALRTLLEMTTSGKSILGKAKLAPKSPIFITAVHTLAQTWSEHADAVEVLAAAQKSKDPEIRGAVRSGLSDAAKAKGEAS